MAKNCPKGKNKKRKMPKGIMAAIDDAVEQMMDKKDKRKEKNIKTEKDAKKAINTLKNKKKKEEKSGASPDLMKKMQQRGLFK